MSSIALALRPTDFAEAARPARRPLLSRGWVGLAAVPAAVACGNFALLVGLIDSRSPAYSPLFNSLVGDFVRTFGGNGPWSLPALSVPLAGPGVAAGLAFLIRRNGPGDRTWKPLAYLPAAWLGLTALVAGVFVGALTLNWVLS